jgi:hypothetical protein
MFSTKQIRCISLTVIIAPAAKLLSEEMKVKTRDKRLFTELFNTRNNVKYMNSTA